MDGTLLGLLEEAVELLRPDRYFFTGTSMIIADVNDVYHHMGKLTDLPEKQGIFPDFELKKWPAAIKNKEPLHFAMMLCNEFQHIRKNNKATFPVADMAAVAKA